MANSLYSILSRNEISVTQPLIYKLEPSALSDMILTSICSDDEINAPPRVAINPPLVFILRGRSDASLNSN